MLVSIRVAAFPMNVTFMAPMAPMGRRRMRPSVPLIEHAVHALGFYGALVIVLRARLRHGKPFKQTR
jgi:hypothetical protein